MFVVLSNYTKPNNTCVIDHSPHDRWRCRLLSLRRGDIEGHTVIALLFNVPDTFPVYVVAYYIYVKTDIGKIGHEAVIVQIRVGASLR